MYAPWNGKIKEEKKTEKKRKTIKISPKRNKKQKERKKILRYINTMKLISKYNKEMFW